MIVDRTRGMEDLSRQADSETCRIESQTGREDKKMVNMCMGI